MVSRSRTTEVSPPQFGLPHVTTEPSSRIAGLDVWPEPAARSSAGLGPLSGHHLDVDRPMYEPHYLHSTGSLRMRLQWQAMRSIVQRTSGRLQVPYFGGLWNGKALTATTRATVTSSIVRSKSQANAYHAYQCGTGHFTSWWSGGFVGRWTGGPPPVVDFQWGFEFISQNIGGAKFTPQLWCPLDLGYLGPAETWMVFW
jgi:hypothetical protein